MSCFKEKHLSIVIEKCSRLLSGISSAIYFWYSLIEETDFETLMKKVEGETKLLRTGQILNWLFENMAIHSNGSHFTCSGYTMRIIIVGQI